jgi:hypothetical protein
MSAKAAWPGGEMTDRFDEFVCSPDLWRPVFPEGAQREVLADVVLNHLMVPPHADTKLVPNTHLQRVLTKVQAEDPEPDQMVVAVLTEQVDRLTGGSGEMDDIERAATDIANLMNEIGRQYVGYMMRTGQTR